MSLQKYLCALIFALTTVFAKGQDTCTLRYSNSFKNSLKITQSILKLKNPQYLDSLIQNDNSIKKIFSDLNYNKESFYSRITFNLVKNNLEYDSSRNLRTYDSVFYNLIQANKNEIKFLNTKSAKFYKIQFEFLLEADNKNLTYKIIEYSNNKYKFIFSRYYHL